MCLTHPSIKQWKWEIIYHSPYPDQEKRTGEKDLEVEVYDEKQDKILVKI